MRKLFLPLSIVFAVLICVPACRVIPDEKKTSVRESRDQQQALTAGDAVLNAIRSGNYKAYAKYFGDMVTEQEFQASQKSLHAQFGTLENTSISPHWKLRWWTIISGGSLSGARIPKAGSFCSRFCSVLFPGSVTTGNSG